MEIPNREELPTWKTREVHARVSRVFAPSAGAWATWLLLLPLLGCHESKPAAHDDAAANDARADASNDVRSADLSALPSPDGARVSEDVVPRPDLVRADGGGTSGDARPLSDMAPPDAPRPGDDVGPRLDVGPPDAPAGNETHLDLAPADGGKLDADVSPVLRACGNGVVERGEECDDGNTVAGDGCDSNCTLTACGNGVKSPGEECDDGNTVDDDGCNRVCRASACGNGKVEPGEVCYGPAAGFRAGDTPVHMAAADFDEDGATDLAVADQNGNTLLVFRDQGNGYLQLPLRLNHSAPVRVESDDVNEDHHADLIVLSLNGYVDILLGTGHGAFQPSTHLGVGTSPVGLATGDFDGDHHRDIVVSNYGSMNLDVFYGAGDGTFSPSTRLAVAKPGNTSPNPAYVAAGDLNGDGMDDVVVPLQSGGTEWVYAFVSLGAARGFAAAKGTELWTDLLAPTGIDVGDLDHDGKLDVVVSGGTYGDKVGVFIGLGDGSFAKPVYLRSNTPDGMGSSSSGEVVVHDLDADGNLDILTVLVDEEWVSVLYGKGDGTFATPVFYDAPNHPTTLRVADFNGDGKSDLAVNGVLSKNVSVLLGRGSRTMAATPTWAWSETIGLTSPLAADLDGDHHLDIVFNSHKGLGFLRGHGDGTFDEPTLPSSYNCTMLAVDVNGDGRTDMVCNGTALLQQADGSFEQVSIPIGGQRMVAADVDADGKLDLVAIGSSISEVSVHQAFGQGDGTFVPASEIGSKDTYQSNSLALGDFDGNGYPEAAVGDYDALGVFALSTGGWFQGFRELRAGYAVREVLAVDLNRDGLADLAMSEGSPSPASLRVYFGDRTSPLSSSLTTQANMKVGMLAVLDANADKVIDLAANNGAGVTLFRGKGAWAFGEVFYLAAGSKPTKCMVMGDFNEDGVDDVAICAPNVLRQLAEPVLKIFLSDP